MRSDAADVRPRPRCAPHPFSRAHMALLLALVSAYVTAAAAADKVTVVDTATALKRSIDGGAPHVHVTAHMDLTTLPKVPNPDGPVNVNDTAVFWPSASLQSVTVRARSPWNLAAGFEVLARVHGFNSRLSCAA
jgi:hypothetical protein